MLKKSAGNMYNWVTHTHGHLAGKCSHACSYCYVQAMGERFPAMKAKYSGPIRLIKSELSVDYGSEKTIFIEHMNDLFADGVTDEMIGHIICHVNGFPDNKYVFQTKNPLRAEGWLLKSGIKSFMIGTTIESNREYPSISKAPSPENRRRGMMAFIGKAETFITIEPILDCDVDHLCAIICDIKPAFVNIGADSKGCNLPEPSPAKIKELVRNLQTAGIVIRKKSNLSRLMDAK